MSNTQRKKAETLLELHHSGELLVLPNIWNVFGTKLVEAEGFEAIATASASVAFSKGYDDNEEIAFADLLKLFQSITNCTPLPVTADIERGYADTLKGLEENIKGLINSGVVGLNIEDSNAQGQLEPIEIQCEKIRSIRKVSDKMGIPLVINARTDAFLKEGKDEDKLSEALVRGQQFKDAGADCFYPVLCSNESLIEINQKIDLPVNVLAQGHVPPIEELERLKISRMSLGPALFKNVVMKMQAVLQSLKNGERFDSFINENTIASGKIVEIIKS